MISSSMDEPTERDYIEESIAAVEQATGSRPTGWVGQDFGESTRTPELLAASGMDWVGDWANDDQPYAMTCGRPQSLLSIPYQAEWDDLQLLKVRRLPQPRYPEVVADAFTTLHTEGGDSGRTFCLGVHPWFSGQPHRIRYLDEAIGRILEVGEIWRATAGEIATHLLDPARA